LTFSHSIRAAIAAALLGLVPAATAQDHVVPLEELHERTQAAAQKREADLEQLAGFFETEVAAKALRSVKMSGEQVRRAVNTLTDSELAKLSERARQANSDFAAGALTNQELTYIIIALATAVVILVIVAA
jgi:hypothetical protein